MKSIKAVIIENNGHYEARCGNCGKLLLTFRKLYDTVDKTSQKVIIVSRCTRSDCKVDNEIVVTP